MAFRKVLEWPHPQLRAVSTPATAEDDVVTLLKDMEDTLRVSRGLGLAAPQIGVSKQVVILDVSTFNFSNPDVNSSPLEDSNLWVIMNPKILNSEGILEWEEGCLSVPGISVKVKRAEKIKLIYDDAAGDSKELHLESFLAAAVQHECDHLEGKLILNRVSPLVSRMIKKKITKRRSKLEQFRKSLYAEDPKPFKKSNSKTRLSKKELKKRKKNRKK